MRIRVKLTGWAVAVLAAALAFSGCEDDDSDLTGNEFRIEPGEVTMAVDDETVTLTAVGGIEPLEWTVSNEEVGTVNGEGRSVVYAKAVDGGVNVVKVTDSRTWEASATISQRDTSDESISLSPASATLQYAVDTAAFTASGGTPPFSWSLSHSDRGRLSVQGDSAGAVYERTASGDNTVIVSDAAGFSAVAAVSQPEAAAPSVTANPSTLSSDGDKSILTVSGGVAPYTWTLGDDSLGGLNTSTGSSVVYTRNHAGDNVITVVDAEGRSANVIIDQP